MPYIRSEEKNRAEWTPQTPGELNYALTCLVRGYLQRKGLSYTHLNDCIGALEAAKLELYRRVAVPYEDRKRAENGDVYSVEVPGVVQQEREPAPQYGEWANGRQASDAAERDYTLEDICSKDAPFGYRFECCRPVGHSGDHVAHYAENKVCARWKQDERRSGTERRRFSPLGGTPWMGRRQGGDRRKRA